MAISPDGATTAADALGEAGQAPALEITGLCKTFGPTTAVDHVDLTVPGRSFFGLVGPNGAGKTTTLSMAVGLLRPDAGRIRLLGVDVWTDPVRAKTLVGVLPDGLSLPERLTGRELLTYLGQLRGLDTPTVVQRTGELLEVLELADAGTTLVVDYSAGMRKKIGLAAALLHAPRVLVLDEPFEALDPVSASTIRHHLATLRRQRRGRGPLQPRHDGRRTALRPRRRHRRRAGGGAGSGGSGQRRAEPGGSIRPPRGRPHRRR